MDVICGLVYMCYLLEPLPFGIYLFLKDQRRLARVGLGICNRAYRQLRDLRVLSGSPAVVR